MIGQPGVRGQIAAPPVGMGRQLATGRVTTQSLSMEGNTVLEQEQRRCYASLLTAQVSKQYCAGDAMLLY